MELPVCSLRPPAAAVDRGSGSRTSSIGKNVADPYCEPAHPFMINNGGGIVFVRVPSDKTVTVAWMPRELVRDLRTRVVFKATAGDNASCTECFGGKQSRAKQPPWARDCYLRLAAKPMREDMEVGSYLTAGDRHANAFLIPRSRGGCFIISFGILCILFLATVMSMCTCGLSFLVFPFLVPWLFILPWFLL